MKSTKGISLMLAGAAVGLMTAGAAKAQSPYVDYNIVNSEADLLTFTGNFNGAQIDSGNGFLAGGIQVAQVNTGQYPGAGLPNTFTTVCTDLGGTLYLGDNYTYDAPMAFGPGTTGLAPTWGYGSPTTGNPAYAAAAIQNAAFLYYNYGSVLGGNNVSAQAGLQLAIWEALYDTGINGGAPALQVGDTAGYRFQIAGGGNGSAADVTAIADANTFLAALDSSANFGNFGFAGYLLIPDPASQNGLTAQELLIGSGQFTPAGSVPEPSAYAAATSALALLTLLGMGRKLNRSRA